MQNSSRSSSSSSSNNNVNCSFSSIEAVCNSFSNFGFQSSSSRNIVGGASSFFTAEAPLFMPSSYVPSRTSNRPMVAPSQPPPGFQYPQMMNHPSGYFLGNDGNVAARNYPDGGGIRVDKINSGFPLLRKLGLLPIMTCKDGLGEFDTIVRICNECQLHQIALRVTLNTAEFIQVAKNQYGSTAIRKLVGKFQHVDDLIFLAVRQTFFLLMTSRYAYYIVKETLAVVDRERRQAIYGLMETYALHLARDEVGCASLNTIMDNMRGPSRDNILNVIISNALWLALDPSGNFVVQNVLSYHNPFVTERIAVSLQGNYVPMSMQKLGSYVVEKCLNAPEGIEYVIGDLISSNELVRLARHEFGNYVVQTALRVTKVKGKVEYYERLVEKLRPHLGTLRTGFGKNIFNLITGQTEY